MGKKGKKPKKKGRVGPHYAEKLVVDKKKEKYSIDQLLDRAEEYVDTFEFELAQKFCQRALEMDPDNIRALETSGTLLLELGNTDSAKHCFGRAVELEPDHGHAKFMYLGQLFTGNEAIQFFNKGVEIMKKILEKNNGACAKPEETVSKSDISSAYCSMAEIYMTDKCFDDDADVKCKECLDQALNYDDLNPEVYQLLASYWLSKEDKNNAKNMIEKCVSLWLPQLKQHSEDPESMTSDPLQACPVSYPARLQVSRTLIEVENYDMASEILELLLDEDEDVIEVWYLLGWLNYLQGEDYYGNARTYLQKAVKVKEKHGCEDVQIEQHINEILQELGPGELEENDAEEGEVDLENYETDEEMEMESSGRGNKNKQETDNKISEQAMEH